VVDALAAWRAVCQFGVWCPVGTTTGEKFLPAVGADIWTTELQDYVLSWVESAFGLVLIPRSVPVHSCHRFSISDLGDAGTKSRYTAFMDLSEIVWVIIFVAGFCWEMVGVFTEKQTRVEPLTTIVRDRLMRKHPAVKLVVFLFIAWQFGHFFLGVGP
jgi:hypothetical protein